MILSSDELEVLEYLKSWNGNSVSMIEICRFAGGRRKFKESPHWAKGLMSRLVEAGLIEVNERGHYCVAMEDKPAAQPLPKSAVEGQTVGDDYFPVSDAAETGEDELPPPEESEPKRWISPQLEKILRQAGKRI